MVELAPFGVEAWLNKWEKKARYDISQSTIASLSMADLRELDDDPNTLDKLLFDAKLNYGLIEGSPAFKEAVAQLYEHVDPTRFCKLTGPLVLT